MSQATYPAFAAYGAASLHYPVLNEPDLALRGRPTPTQLDLYHSTNNQSFLVSHDYIDGAYPEIGLDLHFEHHGSSLHQERGSFGGHAPLPRRLRPFPLNDSEDIFSDPIACFYRDAEGPWNGDRAAKIQPTGCAPTLHAATREPGSGRFRSLSDISVLSEPSDLSHFEAPAPSKGIIRDRSTVANQIDSGTAACRECDGAAQGEDDVNATASPTTTTVKATTRRPKLFHCCTCHRNFKCASDLKKDRRKHCKPFTCSVPGCARGENLGFTTVNDLNRHQKSVHPEEMMAAANAPTSTSTSTSTSATAASTDAMATRSTATHVHAQMKNVMLTTPSFRCVGPGCTRSGKIWPRRDNFTQHVRRVHGEEGLADIVRRSLCYPNGAPPVDENSHARGASDAKSPSKQKSGRKRKRSRTKTRKDSDAACELPSLSLPHQDAYAGGSGPGAFL